MRLAVPALLAAFAACAAEGGHPARRPDRRAALPAPSVQSERPQAAPAVSDPPARAAPAAMVPPGVVRLGAIDPHRAALFLARVFRVDVIVVGGSGEPVTTGIRAETPDGAMNELATAAGLEATRVGQDFVLSPASALDRGARADSRGGRRVDLFFHRVDVADVVRLIADIDGRTVEGSLCGTISMAVRGMRSHELLGSLAALAGSTARQGRRAFTLSGRGTLPPTPEGSGEPCEPSVDPVPRAVELPCVPVQALEVCGTATLGDHGLALVRRHGPGPGSGIAAEVREGSWIGEPAARVATVDTDGITLEDGSRLRL